MIQAKGPMSKRTVNELKNIGFKVSAVVGDDDLEPETVMVRLIDPWEGILPKLQERFPHITFTQRMRSETA